MASAVAAREVGEDRDLESLPTIPEGYFREEITSPHVCTKLFRFSSDGKERADCVLKLNTNGKPDKFLNEVRTLYLLHPHDHIVPLLGEVYNDGYGFYMPLLSEGNRKVVSLSKQQLAERATIWTYQLSLAVEHCHKHGIVHGDIKIHNLLFDGEVLKLADFGAATSEGDCREGTITTSTTRSPEMFCRKPWSYPIDIWAIGVCAVIMLTSTFPFDCNPMSAYMQFIRLGLPEYGKSQYGYASRYWEKPGKPYFPIVWGHQRLLKRVINRALHVQPESRISASAMVEMFERQWENDASAL